MLFDLIDLLQENRNSYSTMSSFKRTLRSGVYSRNYGLRLIRENDHQGRGLYGRLRLKGMRKGGENYLSSMLKSRRNTIFVLGI